LAELGINTLAGVQAPLSFGQGILFVQAIAVERTISAKAHSSFSTQNKLPFKLLKR